MAKKSSEKKVVRDAGTGKFVPKQEAKKHPKTTVTETIKTNNKRKR